MANRYQVAKTISGDKARHPEHYCPARRCLWKTAEVGPDGAYILNADPCRKHPELNTAPAKKVVEFGQPITAYVRALAEDTFDRIEKSNQAIDQFHRTHG